MSHWTDCTGVAQAGFKWIKKLDAKRNDVDEKSYDHLVESYDVHSRWKNFLFTIPPEMREKLPIPAGYDNVGMFWAFFPFPGRERRHIAFDRLEGHRSGFDCVVTWFNLTDFMLF